MADDDTVRVSSNEFRQDENSGRSDNDRAPMRAPSTKSQCERQDQITTKKLNNDGDRLQPSRENYPPQPPRTGTANRIFVDGQEKKNKSAIAALLAAAIAILTVAALAIALIVLHHADKIQAEMTEMRQNNSMETNYQHLTTYTRWGSSSCPQSPGASLVYSGLMAGHQNATKGGTNFQCMPSMSANVEYTLPSQPGTHDENIIFGTEYSTQVKPQSDKHNVPCAVCLTNSLTTTLMIPATTTCPPSWTEQYYGYLMAQRNGHSTYECVDEAMEILSGSAHQENIAILTHVEASCTGLYPASLIWQAKS